jgi:hypothetical protein
MKNKIVFATATLLLTQLSTFPVRAAELTGTPLPAAATSDTQNAKLPGPGASVLERFRTYTGPRTPAALVALFSAPVAATIQQQPVVALSDGSTKVKIIISIDSTENKSPNVAFRGAKLVSIKRDKADKLDIEALPETGTATASLILLTESFTNEVPLTVAPMLPMEADLSEKAFNAFLGAANASGHPLRDLNNDGRFDYLDDYIFTANYLARQSIAAAVSPSASQNSVPQQVSGDQQPPDAQGQNNGQVAELLQPGGSQSLNTTGSFTGQSYNPQTPPKGSVSAPLQSQGAGTTADAVPVEVTLTEKEIQLDNSPDRHNPATRNERARKIKELMNPTVK